MPHGTKGQGPHPWKSGTKFSSKFSSWGSGFTAQLPQYPLAGKDMGWGPSLGDQRLGNAFKDGSLVGSQNEITDFDGKSIRSGGNTMDGDGASTGAGGGGGSGANPLAGNKLAALRSLEETKPTRRIGRKKSSKGPSRSRVY